VRDLSVLLRRVTRHAYPQVAQGLRKNGDEHSPRVKRHFCRFGKGFESPEVFAAYRPYAATRFASILRSSRLTESGVIGSQPQVGRE
jgi:hypothetical protein